MNINIYSKYKIKYKNYGSSIDQETSTPEEHIFKKFRYAHTIVADGGTLIKRIAKYILADHFQEIKVKDNNITIEFFNTLWGENSTIEMAIEEND